MKARLTGPFLDGVIWFAYLSALAGFTALGAAIVGDITGW